MEFTPDGLLIVDTVLSMSRLADEALWAEVLNLGGYDLLASPFDPIEVDRVVTLAWEFRAREVVQKGVDHLRRAIRDSAASS